ncbi:MAG TPA: hypothetical protein VI756_10810 [Blastocatellia bacterium]
MTLGEYVDAVMKEKGLKALNVENNCNGAITDTYIKNILKGTATNLTVEKLQALAVGLETDEEALFRVARGLPPEPDLSEWPPESLSRAVKRIAGSTDFMRVIKRMLLMQPQQLKELWALIEKTFGGL